MPLPFLAVLLLQVLLLLLMLLLVLLLLLVAGVVVVILNCVVCEGVAKFECECGNKRRMFLHDCGRRSKRNEDKTLPCLTLTPPLHHHHPQDQEEQTLRTPSPQQHHGEWPA